MSQNCEKTVDSTVSKILLSFAVSQFKFENLSCFSLFLEKFKTKP